MSREKSSSANGQANEPNPPPFELNGHRKFFFDTFSTKKVLTLMTRSFPLPLNGPVINRGTFLAASLMSKF